MSCFGSPHSAQDVLSGSDILLPDKTAAVCRTVCDGTEVMLQTSLGTGSLDSLPSSAYSHACLRHHPQVLHITLVRVAHHQHRLTQPDCMYEVYLKSKRSTQLPITIPRLHSPSKLQLWSKFAGGLSCKSLITVGTVLCAFKLVPVWPTVVAARQGCSSATPWMPKPPLSSLRSGALSFLHAAQPASKSSTQHQGSMSAAPDHALLVMHKSICRCCWILEQGRGCSLWQQQLGAIGQLPLSCLLTVWHQLRPASPSMAFRICSPCTR